MIVHSIIAKTQKQIDKHIKTLPSCKTFQFDVMDGKFVKNKSNCFNFKLPRIKKFEAHLMVKDPVSWIKRHGKKVDTIIVHYESIKDFDEIKKVVKKKKLGLAINPKTKIKDIKHLIPKVNQFLIMTVNPGKYGSKFLPENLKKVKQLRKLTKKKIEVDGGINPLTIKKAKAAGANLFVVGSFIEKSPYPVEAFNLMQKLIR